MSHTLYNPFRGCTKVHSISPRPVLVFRNRRLYCSVRHKLIYRTITAYMSVTESMINLISLYTVVFY